MSNYFDNQTNWSWNNNDGKVTVLTDHGSHTHTLDITTVPIGEMVDNPGQVMGDAHRASSHDMKTENEATTDIESPFFSADNTIDNSSQTTVVEESSAETSVEIGGVEDDGDGVNGNDGIDNDDGLDM